MQEIIYSKNEINKVISFLLRKASNSVVVFLNGEIGTGKTFLVSHLLKNLGVTETITSPTYSIFNEYQTEEINIYHYDLYRIKKAEELMFIDIDENRDNGMLIIEWPQLAKEYGIQPDIEVTLSCTENFKSRKAQIILYNEN
ncbi:MAG: tRNA threonylcarbamoyladenosine biosynthesis protein TsaE [Candidatus Deianiraeaceae bacterium]|jgi:tRNA threonylcarbamoyladenosine biosynthesis protein TsaE